MIFGICGPMASGKSTFARARAPFFHADICEVDELARSLYADKNICLQLQHFFGAGIFRNGMLSRSRLAAAAFRNTSSLMALNTLFHAPMREMMREKIQWARKHHLSLFVVAALPNAFCVREECDDIFFLSIEKERAWKRVVRRKSSFSREQFSLLWNAQRRDAEHIFPHTPTL